MLEFIGLTIAFISAVWLMEYVLRNPLNDNRVFVLSIFGYPSAIYVLLSYLYGMKYIPSDMLNEIILFMSIGVLGVNAGRVIITLAIIEEMKRDFKSYSKCIIFYTFLETGAVYLLLSFILGNMAFEENDWSLVLKNPNYFLPGMEILSTSIFIGAIAVGWIIRRTMDEIHREGKDLRGEGFRKVMIYSAFPQAIWTIGLLITLLTYMGEVSISL